LAIDSVQLPTIGTSSPVGHAIGDLGELRANAGQMASAPASLAFKSWGHVHILDVELLNYRRIPLAFKAASGRHDRVVVGGVGQDGDFLETAAGDSLFTIMGA
jgi:hypothetical protein